MFAASAKVSWVVTLINRFLKSLARRSSSVGGGQRSVFHLRNGAVTLQGNAVAELDAI